MIEEIILLLGVCFSILACASACVSVLDDLFTIKARRRIYDEMLSEVNRIRLEVKIRRGE